MFIDVVHRVDCIADAAARVRELDALSGEIRARNAGVFFAGVENQALPVGRGIGGRWFDESPQMATASDQA